MAKRILLGLTTITPGEWRNKVKEIDELGLKEIAIFPTSLDPVERWELYGLLEKTGLKTIPFVHLRNDMEFEEIDFIANRFRVEIFSVHSETDHYSPAVDYKKYFKMIYVENTPGHVPTENDLKKYAGLCFDLSHWESCDLEKAENNRESRQLRILAGEHKIGVNHISAIKPEIVHSYDKLAKMDFYGYDDHYVNNLSEVDYIKKYKDYLADIISLEMENSLKRQLEIKKYLEEMLNL